MFYISISMQLSLSAAGASWSVSYSPEYLCVLENSSVDFSCSFDYPYSYTIVTNKWFKLRTNQKQDGSQEEIFVYHSNPEEIHIRYKNRAAYANKHKNCSLTLHNVSKIDRGKYFFRYESDYYYGKYTGVGGIKLNVAVKTQKRNGDVHEGDSVTLSCEMENCTPTREPFVWFKNGLLLSGAMDQELHLASVSHEDLGNYSCSLKNFNRTLVNETRLDVRYSSKNVQITILPSDEIEEGNSLTLNCMSHANPALTNYTWFMIRDTNTSYVGCESKYSIRSVSQTDAGRYFCVATNDIGSQSSTVKELKVKVQGHPHFLLFATAGLLLGIAVTLIIFTVMKRRKQFISSQKQVPEKTTTVLITEEVYENLRNSLTSKEDTTNLVYADLMLPPSSSDSQEDTPVIYSILKNKEETEKITKQI